MSWDPSDEFAGTATALAELGRAFAELRRFRGYSQRGLALRSGVAQSTISRFEAGNAPWLSSGRLAAMLLVLGAISVDADRRDPALALRPLDWVWRGR